MKIEQRAGRFRIETWTDGWPHWLKIERDGQDITHGLVADDLHDLRYCMDRVLIALEAHERNR